jgi:L-amino acid N-acyltransferase YncA/N-acetylglutamate synthase-like GNAT family acetyltransferase
MREPIFADIQEEDLPVVLDIYNHYIVTTTVTFDPGPISMDTLRTRIHLGHDLYKAYVICHMGEIVGFCFLSQFNKHESYNRTAELGLYFKPQYVRRGLGITAVRYLEQVAAAKRLKMLIASISGENKSSIALFRKLHWEECARFRRVAEKWGRAIDVVFFQKSLEDDITASGHRMCSSVQGNLMTPANDIVIQKASIEDAQDILELQKLAYVSEAEILNDFTIPPLHQTTDQMLAEFDHQVFLKVELEGRIVGSVRCYLEEGTCHVSKLIVHPDHQNRGIGTRLLQAAEGRYPNADRYELFTSHKSEKNLHIYGKCGYRPFKTKVISDEVSLVFLEKANAEI